VEIELNDKPAGNEFMMELGLGKGQGFADKARQTLAKGGVPTFRMSGVSSVLADRMMGTAGQNSLICEPEVSLDSTATVSRRNSLPQTTAGHGTPVPNHKGNTLAGAAARRRPQPGFIRLAIDESPQLVRFQDITLSLGQQPVPHARQLLNVRLYPVHHRLACHTVDPSQPAQTRPFLIGAQYLLSPLGIVALFRLQHPIGSTVFAMILRLSSFILAVSDDILAAAHATFVGGHHLNHAV
jgi:hypothetical protein